MYQNNDDESFAKIYKLMLSIADFFVQQKSVMDGEDFILQAQQGDLPESLPHDPSEAIEKVKLMKYLIRQRGVLEGKIIFMNSFLIHLEKISKELGMS